MLICGTKFGTCFNIDCHWHDVPAESKIQEDIFMQSEDLIRLEAMSGQLFLIPVYLQNKRQQFVKPLYSGKRGNFVGNCVCIHKVPNFLTVCSLEEV